MGQEQSKDYDEKEPKCDCDFCLRKYDEKLKNLECKCPGYVKDDD